MPRKKKAPKSGAVRRRSAVENTLDHMPKYNGYACGHGAHGDSKYNRAKAKRAWQDELEPRGARNRGLLPFAAANNIGATCAIMLAKRNENVSKSPQRNTNREPFMALSQIDGKWLAAELPDGFAPLPHDELEALMGYEYASMWGTRDSVRHMLACVTWKDSSKLLTRLVSEKSLARQVEETFARRYRGNGYRCSGLFSRDVSGASASAQGFRCAYEVEGVAHEGEVLVFKRGIRCYTLYYYTPSETAQVNRPAFEALVASLELR